MNSRARSARLAASRALLASIGFVLLVRPATADEVAKPEHPPLGASKQTTTGKVQTPYKLFIPAVYEKDASRQFPLLIHHNPGGNPRITTYQPWAEEQGVIVVGIDKVSNGMPTHEKPRLQDAVLADLTARGIRAHPELRFVIGMSGGSADGMRLVRRKPERFAGAVLMGAGGVLDQDKARHLAYAILGGAKDEWMPGDGCYANAEKAREWGSPVRLLVDIDRQHREAPLEQQLSALTWLIELQKLRMATVPEEERKANLAAARERLKRLPSITDPQKALAEAQLLLDLPPLREFKEESDAAFAAWEDALLALAKQQSGAVAQHRYLVEQGLQAALTIKPPDSATRRLTALQKELAKKPEVERDWKLQESFLAYSEREIRAGIKPEKLGEILPLWEDLAKKAAGTDWEPKIQRRIRICKLLIETPSTIQHPTRIRE